MTKQLQEVLEVQTIEEALANNPEIQKAISKYGLNVLDRESDDTFTPEALGVTQEGDIVALNGRTMVSTLKVSKEGLFVTPWDTNGVFFGSKVNEAKVLDYNYSLVLDRMKIVAYVSLDDICSCGNQSTFVVNHGECKECYFL